MRIATLFLCLMFLLTMCPAVAQDGYPLPDDLQPITIENAAQIKPLASMGGLLPGGLKWLDNGKMLVVGTSAGAQLYDTAQLQQPPINLPDVLYAGTVFLNDKGELVVDAQRHDSHTGELISTEPLPAKPMVSPSGKIEIKVRQTDIETIIDLKKSAAEILSLHTGAKDEFSQLVFSPDEQYALLILTKTIDEFTTVPAITFWNLKTGERIINQLQTLELLDQVTFFANGKLLIIESHSDEPYGGPFQQLDILDGRTGEVVGPSGLFMDSSRNGKLFAILRFDQIDIWSDHLLGSMKTEEYFSEGLAPSVIFSPDSSTLANTIGQSITLWDVTGDSIPKVPRLTIPTSNAISGLIYSPDGKLLISIDVNNMVEVWDSLTGAKRQLFTPTSGHSIYSPIFSADGKFIRATERDGNTLVWNVATGEQVATLPASSIFSGDGLQAAYWDGGLVWVFDVRKTQQTPLKIIENYQGRIAAFNPNSHIAVFAGSDFAAYDVQSGNEMMRQSSGENAKLAWFNTDGSRFMTFIKPAMDGQNDLVDVKVWSINDLQKPISEIKTNSRWGAWELSPNGNVLVESNGSCGDGGGGFYRVWSASTGDLLFRDGGDDCGPNASSFSPDNKWLLMAWGGRLDVIDMDAAIQEGISDKDHVVRKSTKRMYYAGYSGQNDIVNIIFSPDGRTVALTNMLNSNFEGPPNSSYRISLYNLSDLLVLEDNSNLSDPAVTIPDAQAAIFSPNSRWLLTDVGLWDLATGKQAAPFSSKIAAFSPDSSILATYDQRTNKVMLLDMSKLATGAELPITTLEIPKRRQGYQDELAFSSDAELLYLKREGDIQIWGVPESNP